VALRPDLAAVKKVVYFHENQLSYPRQTRAGERERRDFFYGHAQIVTALAADTLIFNSRFNRDSFLANVDRHMAQAPDYRVKGLADDVAPKCLVIPPCPLEFGRGRPTDWRRLAGPLRLVWPHRWEHDKNPTSLFQVLDRLVEAGCDFRASVLGEGFSEEPDVFDQAKARLADKIDRWGYLESKEDYWSALQEADVVISTADHEFYGLSVAEAAIAGSLPLLPRRLVYPELYKDGCLYNTDGQLFKKLRDYCRKPHLVAVHLASMGGSPFKNPPLVEEELCQRYRSALTTTSGQ